MNKHKATSDMVSVPKAYKEIVSWLNTVLANEFALFTKTLNYHWNITGPGFLSLHTLLDAQYREVLGIMDQVAERIRILDERPLSSIKSMCSNIEILDEKNETPSSDAMFRNLLQDHLSIQSQLREIVTETKKFSDDPGSDDLLIKILGQHEIMSWKLRSHLIKQ